MIFKVIDYGSKNNRISSKMQFFTAVLFSIFLSLGYQCKPQSIKIDSLVACAGDTALISIHISAMDSVGAITLYIGYDTSKLNFIGLTDINVHLSGLSYNDMRSGGIRIGKIGISWSNAGGENFSAGLFAVLKFGVVAGNCPVYFSGNCEIANYYAQIMNITFIDGELSVPPVPIISAQPENLSLNLADIGYYSISSSGAESFQWQINRGNGWINIQNNNTFQGYNNDTLYISYPQDTLNGAYFRCLVRNACLYLSSDSAVLTVTGQTVQENDMTFSNAYPNPFVDHFSIDLPQVTFIEKILIFDSYGKFIESIMINSVLSQLTIKQFHKLEEGAYLFEMITKNKSGFKSMIFFKIIKKK